jgi:AcrR family transcriptional regulator
MSKSKTKRPTRTRQSKEQRIADILDSAEEVFNEHGYEKATVAEIAERVGVVEGTVFSYFKSKHDLVFQITKRWYLTRFAELKKGLRGIVGTRNRLRYITWSQLIAVTERAEFSGVILLAARGIDKKFTREINTLYGQYTLPLIQTLKEGMEAGEVRKDIHPELVSHMLYGGIEQLLWKMLQDGQKINTEEVADEMVALVFGGILLQSAAAEERRSDALLARLEKLLNK